jgi:monofunctional biosynthetic peptidoglycan transglycosylase
MLLIVPVIILTGLTVYLLWEVRRWRKAVAPARGWAGWLRVAAAALAWAAVLYHAGILLRVVRLTEANPSTTAIMEQREGEARARGTAVARDWQWVGFEQISPNMIHAVIAGEDPQFLMHSGVNWDAMLGAAQENLDERRIVRGGSTISQQLAKNLFLSTSRTPLRKLHEMVIAHELELSLGKRRILELYLNVIEWGDGVYGVEAAARHYFNTSASALTEEQCSFLTAILPMPLAGVTPDNPPALVRDRMHLIAESMHNSVRLEEIR